MRCENSPLECLCTWHLVSWNIEGSGRVLSDVLSQIEGPWNILGLQELSPAHEGDSFEFQGAL